MDKTHQSILDIYKFRLRHYGEMGIGNTSKITGTIITINMVSTCLERYLELGGSLSFVQDYDMTEYNEFIDEIKES